ncbi:MAG: choice-of-anchor L domain-containing protein [Flavobacterium sp.]|nr:choice-of-anchor L domain-containing protein [Flavobacterium sp.]
MKKLLLLTMLSLFGLSAQAQCDTQFQCNYTFVMSDSYGDGWNGNTMTILQNGAEVATLGTAFTSGYDSSVTVPLCTGSQFQVRWNIGNGNNYPDEVGLSILNGFQQTIFIMPFNSISLQNTIIFAGDVNCTSPLCTPPTLSSIQVLSGNSAQIQWDYYSAQDQWEVLVLPAGSPTPDASANGVAVTTISYTATGLVNGTEYAVYLRTICADNQKSDWTNAQFFTTYCPTPSQLYTSATTPTGATVGWAENGGASQWEVLILPVGSPEPTTASSGVLTTSNPYVATGLTTGTVYKCYVRAICPSGQPTWSDSVYLYPSCTPPAMLYVAGISAFGANLSWAEMGTATQWEVIVQPSNLNAPSATSTGTLTSSINFTVSGLTTNVSYKFYVRAVCGALPGNWSASTAFIPTVALPPLQTSTTQYTTAQLVTNVLVDNPCVAISNITSSTGTNFGSVNGIGSFTNINPLFPLTSGIVLSTGSALNAPGPNSTTLSDGIPAWTGDSELENIITTATGNVMNSHNASKLEFDFTTQNAFMSFNFLFASDEYGTYQCDYSDAFAFLLTDLTTNVTTNLAIVPNTTTPISVVTIRDEVNNPQCSSENELFFDEYFYNTPFASATNFNGQTAVMTAAAQIDPTHTYHIKLVVADRGDNAFDSAVFIQAGSFAAGPPECTDKIKLVAFVDVNVNGTRDTGEPDFTYGSFIYQQNNTGDINNISSPLGYYTLYDANPANTYDFSYAINAEFASYFTVAPTAFNDLNIPVGSGTQTLYFPIVLTQGFNDVTVSIVPTSSPVPGIGYTNKIVFRNLGIQPASGTLTFNADPLTTILNASQFTTLTSSALTYDFTNLAPYETRSIYVSIAVPAIPTVNIGDLLTDSASIAAPANDINISNNTYTNAQIAVASYDPNDKMEAHGEKIAMNQFNQNDYLTYTIRFQNTGTANAINIRLEDLLDAQLDETSIRMISASHNYVMERVGNHITWRFDYIQLPGAIQNEALSHGYVNFMIKLKPGFTTGDIVPNNAEIYFDANPAITTNTFNTEFFSTLGNSDFNAGNFLIFPNPASTIVQVSLQNTSENIDSITLFDILGKNIKTVKSIGTKQTSVDVSGLSKGVYMMEIITDNKFREVKKLVID